MREISLHIMDVAENGLAAGASLIEISVVEDSKRNRLEIQIRDNGRGIRSDLLERVFDPFYTTRTARRVGLGLSLFREAARRCDGAFGIRSKEGGGTEVYASFRLDHLDRAPLGDMAGSFATLVMGNPGADFLYTHEVAGRAFRMDTREVKKTLEGVPITQPEVIAYLRDYVGQCLNELRSSQQAPSALQKEG